MADIVFENDGELIAIVVDATTEEIHRASAQATEQPVEQGVDLTDHVRPERRTLTLTVVISDTPIRATDALGGAVSAVELDLPARGVHSESARRNQSGKFDSAEVEDRAAPTTSVEVFQPEEEPTRIEDTWRALLDARDRALLATVTTGLETYEEMVLIEVHATRTAKDGSWLRAEVSFAEVRRVSTELVDDPVPAGVSGILCRARRFSNRRRPI